MGLMNTSPPHFHSEKFGGKIRYSCSPIQRFCEQSHVQYQIQTLLASLDNVPVLLIIAVQEQ